MMPCGCMFPKLCEDCRGAGYVLCHKCGGLAVYEDDDGTPLCIDCLPPVIKCYICGRKLTLTWPDGAPGDTWDGGDPACKACEARATERAEERIS